jgi:hypothetical protein
LIPIIKLAGLYNTEYTKSYRIDLLSAASSIYKVPKGDLTLFQSILTRKGYWWEPDEKGKPKTNKKNNMVLRVVSKR